MSAPQSDWRVYHRDQCAVFRKTKERFGGLSNMAAGFPLSVGGEIVLTSEALYQACRFPHRPDVQRVILDQASPMTAKMKSKPHRPDTRPDWEAVRVPVMRWCLRVKLVQNWDSFASVLISTGTGPIVEESRRDTFWGAKPDPDGEMLTGRNILGRLLMELRQVVQDRELDRLTSVSPPEVDHFVLLGKPIPLIQAREADAGALESGDPGAGKDGSAAESSPERVAIQSRLFDS